MTIKLCKDCKWCTTDYSGYRAWCKHESAVSSVSLVNGRVYFIHCNTNRMLKCGTDAKYFEPKQSILVKIISFFKR